MAQWEVFKQPERTGITHIENGHGQCQDKVAVKRDNELIVAVLSDGVGSLSHSGVAANLITDHISTFLLNYNYTNFNSQHLKLAILSECKSVLKQYCSSTGSDISQMACTLPFVVLKTNLSEFICGQLGDGAICIIKETEALLFSSLKGYEPFVDSQNLATNFTKTVCSSNASNYFNICKYSAKDYVGFILTSDGLENEIFLGIGNVKQKVQDYYNLVSHETPKTSEQCIDKWWNDLQTKPEFTDDFSLVIIYQNGKTIALPPDAKWLCICGQRNAIENTRCENANCRKDRMRVYKNINFDKYGGVYEFFNYLNASPQEEIKMLHKHCAYQLEDSPVINLNSQKHTSDDPETESEQQNQTNLNQQEPKVTKAAVAYGKRGDEKICKSKINFFACLCLFLAFVVGAVVHQLYDISTKDHSKAASEILKLQEEAAGLKSNNDALFNTIDFLNTRIAELEDAQKESMHIYGEYEYYAFPTGDIYIGQLSQGVPNGVGVVYTSGVLEVGLYQSGVRIGEFYSLYNDGHSEIHNYSEGTLITDSQTDEADEPPNMKPDNIANSSSIAPSSGNEVLGGN